MPSPKKGVIHVDPPLGGTVRKMGFQKQEPFSTIDSTNMWPLNSIDNRLALATRPPLERYLEVDDNINLLCRVSGDGNQDPQQTFVYASEGDLYVWTGTGFDQVDTAFAPATVPAVTTGRAVYATPFLEKVVIANSGTPLVYDHDADLLTNRITYLTATAGTVPVDCRIVVTWQGAVWFAGAPDAPHILYASRTGDITDYDYFALPEDEGGAFATIDDNEGLIGEPITALMPQTTDTMVVGCLDSMWAIKGHPRRGGSVESISTKIGPLGQGAWAKAPDNTLFVLTKVGIVTIAPQDGSIPALISKEKIPNELIGLEFDPLDPTISMAYDTVWNGLIINKRGDNEQSWWFDPQYGGFHKMALTVSGPPTVMLTFPSLDSATASGCLFGGEFGLYRFDAMGVNETPVWSVFIGPIKISPNALLKSKVETVKVVLGAETIPGTGDEGTFGVFVGVDGEEAYNNANNSRAGTGYEVSTSVLIANNGLIRPQLSGHAVILRAFGTDRFIFESADMVFVEAGQMRAMKNWSVEPRVSAGPDQRVMRV